jgi:hypothetical protein
MKIAEAYLVGCKATTARSGAVATDTGEVPADVDYRI